MVKLAMALAPGPMGGGNVKMGNARFGPLCPFLSFFVTPLVGKDPILVGILGWFPRAQYAV
jgi:hypothetical protein